MTPDDAELAARRAALAHHTMDEANELNERQYRALHSVLGSLVGNIYVPMHQRVCPTCGQPIVIADTPAQDAPKDVSADRGPAPTKRHESWRDRPPLL